MFKNIDTEFGNIGFSKSIVRQIVVNIIEKHEETVWLGNARAIFNIFANEENSNIDVIWDERGISVSICVIVKFGMSISKIANGIIDSVKEQIKITFGEDIPCNVKVEVTGVKLKRHIVKREVEVIG